MNQALIFKRRNIRTHFFALKSFLKDDFFSLNITFKVAKNAVVIEHVGYTVKRIIIIFSKKPRKGSLG
jgi:hypothetical protein